MEDNREPEQKQRLIMVCDICEASIPSHQCVHVVGRGDLCCSCYNDEISERMGVKFDTARLAPVVMVDSTGEGHTFDIVSRLVATGHAMEAIEVREGEERGYSFAIIGDSEADAMTLFGQLYARMRDGLATRHVTSGPCGWELTEADALTGRIESDPSTDHGIPMLVVDGRELTWEEVGQMLIAYEGFTVELKIRDRFDIVGGPLNEPEQQL